MSCSWVVCFRLKGNHVKRFFMKVNRCRSWNQNNVTSFDFCVDVMLSTSAIILGFIGHEDLQTAEATARNAAMRTITIMLPVRYNQSPTPAHEQIIPPTVDAGPSHGPLSGQLVGALPQAPPFVVNRWSARFDVPESSGIDNGSTASEMDHERSAKESASSPLTPGFFFHLLTGGRYQPPRRESPPVELAAWNQSPANEMQLQQLTSQPRPEVEWQPAQLVHRYVELHRQQPPLAVHRDGPRSDKVLKNNVLMTAVAYGLLDSDHSQRLGDRTTSPSTTSTTTAATTNTNRKRKLSPEYRRRASGRYRSYPFAGGRRAVRRHGSFDLSFDSDDEDDEVLEALFGYDRSPMTFRRVRRPSSSLVGTRRAYGRRRLGDGGGDRQRRWRQRGDAPGKLRRRTGARATLSGDREKQAAHSRRPSNSRTVPDKRIEQRTKPDVGPNMDSRRRVSLLHIVVSRQQDFAAPQPAMGFVDHPGLLLEPRPLDVDALHSLPHHPFIQPSPPFLPVRPIIPNAHMQQQQQPDRYVAYQFVVRKLTEHISGMLTRSEVDEAEAEAGQEHEAVAETEANSPKAEADAKIALFFQPNFTS